MKAKDFLKQLRKIEKMIENKSMEKERWRDIALNITATTQGEKVQSTSNPQKMADAVVNYVDIERDIVESIDNLIDARRTVLKVIEQLEVVEYDVLHKIYVQYLTLEDVADMYDKTYSWITTIHGKALKSVQKILDANEGVYNEHRI